MKEVFDELQEIGFFKLYRPFSIMLFAEEIRKKTGASVEVNSDFSVLIRNKNWKIKLGEPIEVSGKFSDRDYLEISDAIATAKAVIYSAISEEVKEYPEEFALFAYNEARLFGFKELDLPKLKMVEKNPFDFPGKYKLGAMFSGNEIVALPKAKKILDEISYFFSHYGDLAYGKIEGEVEKFRIMSLALAKKGDLAAGRVWIALTKGLPIKFTDFEKLNEKFKLEVSFKRFGKWPGEG